VPVRASDLCPAALAITMMSNDLLKAGLGLV
jgi:hypothetical protein